MIIEKHSPVEYVVRLEEKQRVFGVGEVRAIKIDHSKKPSILLPSISINNQFSLDK
jgi:hypothetical protein